jgi:Histidine phosphatase superfamily (branch 1)
MSTMWIMYVEMALYTIAIHGRIQLIELCMYINAWYDLLVGVCELCMYCWQPCSWVHRLCCSCFSSPIRRARTTADIMWQERDGPLLFSDSLKEAHLGWMEGMKQGKLTCACIYALLNRLSRAQQSVVCCLYYSSSTLCSVHICTPELAVLVVVRSFMAKENL